MRQQVALYRGNGELYRHVTESELRRLQTAGLIARVVKHRKGHINRAVMFRRPGEGRASTVRDYLGTQYSFREHLDSGNIAWALKKLGNGDELRPLFLQVVADCLARP